MIKFLTADKLGKAQNLAIIDYRKQA